MSTGNSFDKTQHLAELNSPLFGGSPTPVTPAVRKAAAVTNLGFTQTAAAISTAAAAATSVISVADAATYTVLAADSGKVHILPDFTASCTLTLPTPAAGLQYEFISSAAAADAQNWVFSAGAGNFMQGGLMHADLNAGSASDEIVAVYGNGSSHVTLTVTTPAAGTYVRAVCTGTKWVFNGIVDSDTAPAFS